MKSMFLAVAVAAIGFTYTAPVASALPPSKGAPGVHSFHKKSKPKKVASTSEKKACKWTAKASKRDSGAKVSKRVRTPYFERKRGAPPFRTRR